LDLRLAPGWKTFWRAGGAAGIAPRFDWGGTVGAGAVDARWPAPEVLDIGGIHAIGFAGDLVLPLMVEGTEAGEVALRGTVELGVCREVCLPVRIEIDATLPARGSDDPAIRASLARAPRRADVSATCTMRPTEQGAVLRVALNLPEADAGDAVVFELADPSIWVADPTVTVRGGHLVAEAELMVGGGRRVRVDLERLRVTVIGEGGAVEVQGCRAPS
jgi:DsbC/DsbD-like thiol-disulfide interchange protein